MGVSAIHQAMSHKVFSLKDVPETEANGIRELLAQSGIKFYETPSTFVTDSAILVYEEIDITKAKQLIEKFEIEWQRRNMVMNYSSGQRTWEKLFINLLLWSAIAVVLIYVFETYVVP